MAPPDSPPPPDSGTDDTCACPLCGESIKKVAIRCKHCHGDLSGPIAGLGGKSEQPSADFDRAAPRLAENAPLAGPRPMSDEEFEQRFLEFAYKTSEPLTAISVAHALKIPILVADHRLEALAAGDIIHRDVDDEGGIYFSLPGKRAAGAQALVPQRDPHGPGVGMMPTQPAPPPSEAAATAALVVNLCAPGVGSLIAGKQRAGLAQIGMVVLGLPLCFVFIGFPMIFAAWIWGLVTAGNALQEARLAESTPKLGASDRDRGM